MKSHSSEWGTQNFCSGVGVGVLEARASADQRGGRADYLNGQGSDHHLPLSAEQDTHQSGVKSMGQRHRWLWVFTHVCYLMWLLPAPASPVGGPRMPPERADSPIAVLTASGSGYRELFEAADLCAETPALKNGDWRSASLRTRRASLLSPALRQSLRLIDSGLRKPLRLPDAPVNLPEAEHEKLRLLPRLLGLRMAVQFADGDHAGALKSLEQGVRVVETIQVGGISSSLPALQEGASLLSILPPVAATLPARECEQLTAMLEQPAAAVRARLESVIEAQRLQDQTLLRGRNLEAPELAKALAALDLVYRRLYEQVRVPAWLRTPPPPGDAADAKLVTSGAALDRLVEAHEIWRARLLLLEMTARIERFRWEHRRLPANLAELGDPGKQPDPFSGQPFLYHRRGTNRFEVTSAGPTPSPGRQRKEIALRLGEPNG